MIRVSQSSTDRMQHRGHSLRVILPSVIWDGLCPFLTYRSLMSFVPNMTQAMALGAGAMFPAARVAFEVVKRRRLEALGALVLTGIFAGIMALVVGGPKLFLVRDSFVTGALGLLALCSFFWPRPLLFYIGRQFAAGDDPTAVQAFNASWQYPPARRAFRLMTLVWTVGWLLEAGLRVALVLTLTVSQVLVVSPTLFNGVTLGLVTWTIAYGTRLRHKAEARFGAVHTQ